MRSRLLLIIILFFLYSCNSPSGQEKNVSDNIIQISGILEEGADQLITLDLMEPTAFVTLDSVRCDEDGHFSMTIEARGLNFYSLKFTENGYITLVASPGDKIILTASADYSYPYTVKGSRASELIAELAGKHNETLELLREISRKSDEILGDLNYAEKKLSLNSKFDSITSSFHSYSKDFILNHGNSPAILIALYNQYGPGLPVFDPLKDLDIYQHVDSVLYQNYPENSAVKSLHSQLSSALEQIRNQEQKEEISIGMKAPDFVMPDMKGESRALSDLRGSYVLLQFWASWSKPSRDENPFLKSCAEKFSTKNFAILQVSLDDQKEAWLNAIDETKENWYQLSDLKRWESSAANIYRLERIPANFLISPGGKILAKDIFGEEMITEIEKYIH